MASWDEAFLILKKWRDDPGPPEINVLREFEQAHLAETVMSGGTVHVLRVDEVSGLVSVGWEGAVTEEIDLTGAVFEYADPRSTRLIDGNWECSLEATFPDGTLIVFAELPPVD
ncbi:MAG: hypothetical protein ACLQKA_05530 [Bryobacteraceae bacterium]